MKPVLGIDLGTTNSSCAVFEGRDIVIVPNGRGMRSTPSIVSLLEDGTLIVGEAAKNQAVAHPERTVRWVKRHMGKGESICLAQSKYRPEELSAEILRSLKRDAEAYYGETLTDAVITVPAYFSEPQRRATRAAGELAGLKVRRLLNEPTAAALAYTWYRNRSVPEDGEEALALVYDLGGGTFDVTVLSIRGRDCKVLATCGDNALGGADFDKKLFDHVSSVLVPQLGERVASDPLLTQQLLDLAERTKIELSLSEKVTMTLPFAGVGGEVHPSFTVTRDEFEDLIRGDIDRTLALVGQALSEAGRVPSNVDRLILSGGSSRIPLVRRLLKEYLGREAESRVNPEEVVSMGAAVYANLLGDEADEVVIVDAISRSFGVEIDGDEFAVVIPKNAPLPAKRRRTFTTVSDNQSSVEIHILQGEAPVASKNVSLGRFLLSGIRHGTKGVPRIEVEFLVDADEILHVRAKDVDTGAAGQVTIASSALDQEPSDPVRLKRLAERLRLLMAEETVDTVLHSEIEESLAAVDAVNRTSGEEERMKLGVVMETLIAELEARHAELL